MIEILPLTIHSFGLNIAPPTGSSFVSYSGKKRDRTAGKHLCRGTVGVRTSWVMGKEVPRTCSQGEGGGHAGKSAHLAELCLGSEKASLLREGHSGPDVLSRAPL